MQHGKSLPIRGFQVAIEIRPEVPLWNKKKQQHSNNNKHNQNNVVVFVFSFVLVEIRLNPST